jgi:hypothetical protein
VIRDGKLLVKPQPEDCTYDLCALWEWLRQNA